MVCISEKKLDLVVQLLADDVLECPPPCKFVPDDEQTPTLGKCPGDITCGECWQAFLLDQYPFD